MNKIQNNKLEQIAKEIRRRVVWMSHNSKVGHLASALSIVDLLVVLYFSILKVNSHLPKIRNRDRFILSKGHAASALYAVLAQKGFFPKTWLSSYCKDGSKLGTHPEHTGVPGVEWTTGSLGHGLSVGCGMAISIKKSLPSSRIFVLVSDAECQEGEIWESALTAAQYKLDNLLVLVDYNNVQAFGKVKDVLNLEPFDKKWEAFGWQVEIADGHSISDIHYKLNLLLSSSNKPKILIAKTIRGKGVSFMEHAIEWYYNYPQEPSYSQALKELI